MSALTAFAQPYVPLKTAEEAKALPKTASIMMACGGCKTLKPIASENIAAWFTPRNETRLPRLRRKGLPDGRTANWRPAECLLPAPLNQVRRRLGLSVRQALLTHTQSSRRPFSTGRRFGFRFLEDLARRPCNAANQPLDSLHALTRYGKMRSISGKVRRAKSVLLVRV